MFVAVTHFVNLVLMAYVRPLPAYLVRLLSVQCVEVKILVPSLTSKMNELLKTFVSFVLIRIKGVVGRVK